MLAKYGFVYQPTPLVPGGALCPFDSTTISPAAQFGQMLQLQKEKLYQAGFSDEVLLADWFGYEVCHYIIQPLVELYGGCMVVLKVS
jgi:hypothetical protein